MRIVITALVCVLLLAMRCPTAAKPPLEKELAKPNKLMAEKLKHAQTLLEGLALKDFDKIKDNAQELIRISQAAEWSAYKTPMYEVHTNNFRRAAETIIQKAKAKNIDGATLAYLDMTVTCVRCHEHTREVRDTSFSLPNEQ